MDTDAPQETPPARPPLPPLPRPPVLTARELRAHGVTPAVADARCRPGGPWRMLLPGVFLLRSGEPTAEELLHAALRYTGGRPGEAMVTGCAALALHGLPGLPPVTPAGRVEVLVPKTRRLRSTGWLGIVRAHPLPRLVTARGFPVAPVARALADAVASPGGVPGLRALLTAALRWRACDPQEIVREFDRAGLLGLPHVVDALESLLAEGRTLAEERLMEVVREGGLPEPWWNVELRLPGGARLGAVDAYWPEHAVAVEIDARVPHGSAGRGNHDDTHWAQSAQKRARLEKLGIEVVYLTPRKLRESAEQQVTVVRTALLQAAGRPPGPQVVVAPR